MVDLVLLRRCPVCDKHVKIESNLSEKQATQLAHERTGFHHCEGCGGYLWFKAEHMLLLPSEEAKPCEEGPLIQC